MKASTFLAVLIAAGVCYSSSLAQEKTPRVDKREKIQKERIKDGVKSGELTRRETRRLAAEQKKIRNDEARSKADGIVTPRERARLNKELNRAGRDIHRQKHDNQKRK
jgi:E3 ubiquitin-protein ligase DOA10